MTDLQSLPDVHMSGEPARKRKTRATVPGAMYTVNDEPTWLTEATPTERMRLKYEVRPQNICCH